MSSKEIDKKTGKVIKAKECKFVNFFKERSKLINNKRKIFSKDMHMIKEVLHFEDGTRRNNLKLVFDYKRPFFITKEIYRDHKQKKEFESIDRVDKFYSTESQMANSVASRLGRVGYNRNNMRDIKDNPYVYMADIDSTTLIKKMYLRLYPEAVSDYRVSSLDIEQDVGRTDIITVANVICGDTIHVAVHTHLIKNIDRNTLKEQVLFLFKKHIGTDLELELDIRIFDKESYMMNYLFNKLNEYEPDIVSAWNIKYDLPAIEKRMQLFNINMRDLVSDPRVPRENRHYFFNEESSKKVSSSGKDKNKKPEQLWHKISASSSYVFIDAMCAYSAIRSGQALIPGGYGLDNILKLVLKRGKLKIEDEIANKLEKLEWHRYMTDFKPIEYIVYNIWDTLGMNRLDDKTKDLKATLFSLAGISHIHKFTSQPNRNIDAISFFSLEKHKKVISVLTANPDTDNVLGGDEWIVTLQSDRITNNGLKCILGEDTVTNLKAAIYDADVEASYPTVITVSNVSKETTRKELKDIEGIDKAEFKKQNINLISGNKSNSLEYCINMFNMPNLLTLENLIRKKIEDGKNQ